jgi:hypothetical protein
LISIEMPHWLLFFTFKYFHAKSPFQLLNPQISKASLIFPFFTCSSSKCWLLSNLAVWQPLIHCLLVPLSNRSLLFLTGITVIVT